MKGEAGRGRRKTAEGNKGGWLGSFVNNVQIEGTQHSGIKTCKEHPKNGAPQKNSKAAGRLVRLKGRWVWVGAGGSVGGDKGSVAGKSGVNSTQLGPMGRRKSSSQAQKQAPRRGGVQRRRCTSSAFKVRWGRGSNTNTSTGHPSAWRSRQAK